ncbi:MAG TPA: hypothetical protein VHE35_15015, partial [Kofleriaceae bacterium]|nr:hypothetical protein [Kofleriaceae bacterium]
GSGRVRRMGSLTSRLVLAFTLTLTLGAAGCHHHAAATTPDGTGTGTGSSMGSADGSSMGSADGSSMGSADGSAKQVCCESFGYGAQMVKCCETYAWTAADACVAPAGLVGGGKDVVSDDKCPAP